jgi:hypothetical protein
MTQGRLGNYSRESTIKDLQCKVHPNRRRVIALTKRYQHAVMQGKYGG